MISISQLAGYMPYVSFIGIIHIAGHNESVTWSLATTSNLLYFIDF